MGGGTKHTISRPSEEHLVHGDGAGAGPCAFAEAVVGEAAPDALAGVGGDGRRERRGRERRRVGRLDGVDKEQEIKK